VANHRGCSGKQQTAQDRLSTLSAVRILRFRLGFQNRSHQTARGCCFENNPKTNQDIWVLRLDAGRRAQPLVQTPFSELNGEISPDGRWVAYQSNESGRPEVYARPFPDVNSGRWQISTDGGMRPLWARNGRELFYLTSTGGVMSVAVEEGSGFTVGRPTKLFEGRYYDSAQTADRRPGPTTSHRTAGGF